MEIAKAREKVEDFDTAEKRKVYNEEGEEIEGYRRIVNRNNPDEVYTIATARYTILQHKDFFPKVIDAVDELEIEVRDIEIKSNGGRVFLEFIFAERYNIGEEEILMGVRSGNSFDRSCRAYAGAYGLRKICTNGMMGKGLFGRKAHLHVGRIKVEDISEGLEETLPEAENNLQTVYRANNNKKMSISDAKELLKELKIAKRTREETLNRIPTRPSRWDVYNAVTEIIEHPDDGVTEQTREYKHKKANKILISPE